MQYIHFMDSDTALIPLCTCSQIKTAYMCILDEENRGEMRGDCDMKIISHQENKTTPLLFVKHQPQNILNNINVPPLGDSWLMQTIGV